MERLLKGEFIVAGYHLSKAQEKKVRRFTIKAFHVIGQLASSTVDNS
jgi:hypothetical protein